MAADKGSRIGMKIVIINRSDCRGGAAVASFRLMEALRSEGVDARMLVAEKLSGSPYVAPVADAWRVKSSFLSERLHIFARNGMDRATLFKIDTGECGIDVSRHPWVRMADAIFLGWVNQGILSLKDIRRLTELGKPVVWTMHDMWCMTGICHHAGDCRHYERGEACGECPLLKSVDTPLTRLFGTPAGKDDLSHKTFMRKARLYSGTVITFVAVSRWLGDKARGSALLGDERVEVIGNPFEGGDFVRGRRYDGGELRVLFGAARLDDEIKGLPLLIAALRHLRERDAALASRVTLVTYGGIRRPELLSGLAVRHEHLGAVSPEALPGIFGNADVVVSASYYETFAYTLLEGQAYGCVPVSFDSGGPRDIIDHEETGYLARPHDPEDLAAGILWAAGSLEADGDDIIRRMRQSAEERFSYREIAKKYLSLIY